MTQEELLEQLPHGSGIDAKWEISETHHKWLFHNSYHTMDEHGFYSGWADFTIKVPKTSDRPHEDFELVFNGKNSHYLNQKYLLREYLEDTVACALRPEAGVSDV